MVPQRIAPLVQVIRGEKVLLDADLAELYGVETKVLNQAVKRNSKRFPSDFMFQLSASEWKNLKCQIGTSSLEGAERQQPGDLKSQSVTSKHGGRRTPRYAFTEQGVAMLSSVLNSDRESYAPSSLGVKIDLYLLIREIYLSPFVISGFKKSFDRIVKKIRPELEAKVITSAVHDT